MDSAPDSALWRGPLGSTRLTPAECRSRNIVVRRGLQRTRDQRTPRRPSGSRRRSRRARGAWGAGQQDRSRAGFSRAARVLGALRSEGIRGEVWGTSFRGHRRLTSFFAHSHRDARRADVPGRSAAQRLAPGSAPACADHSPSLRARRDQVLLERYADPLDAVDRDAVVERFRPLPRGLAARHQRHGEPFDDVFPVACFGLVTAVDRSDTKRGVAFSTYGASRGRRVRDPAVIVPAPRARDAWQRCPTEGSGFRRSRARRPSARARGGGPRRSSRGCA